MWCLTPRLMGLSRQGTAATFTDAAQGVLDVLNGPDQRLSPTPVGRSDFVVKELLSGKVILISGGTQGLGAAIARASTREGAAVMISGRNAERGDKVVAELLKNGAEAGFVQTDISEVAAAQASVAATIERYGRIDGLVNAAGLTTRGSVLDTTPELFDQHMAVNLRAPFFLMQAAIADMKLRGEPGSIVNVISIDSHGGQSFLAPYVAAKAGLAGLTKNAAHAHRWDKIRINGLNMGWSATDGEDQTQRRAAQSGDVRAQGAGEDWQTAVGASLPMGKLGQPDEIADFVAFLLSDRSGVVTGSVIDWDQTVIGGLG
jgi:NAD(P)-dependent dehydrogenase (short-subunit alcohol dehydrogenase family)